MGCCSNVTHTRHFMIFFDTWNEQTLNLRFQIRFRSLLINPDRKRLRSHFFFDERVYLLCRLRDNLVAFKNKSGEFGSGSSYLLPNPVRSLGFRTWMVQEISSISSCTSTKSTRTNVFNVGGRYEQTLNLRFRIRFRSLMINQDRKRLRSLFFFDERVYLLCRLRDNLVTFKNYSGEALAPATPDKSSLLWSLRFHAWMTREISMISFCTGTKSMRMRTTHSQYDSG